MQLTRSDFVKGGIIFVTSSVLTSIINMLQSGGFNIDFSAVLNVAAISTLTYLLKNLATENTGEGEYLGGKYKI